MALLPGSRLGPYEIIASIGAPGRGVRRLGQDMATCGYTGTMETGVRELKDNLSRYIRRIEAGARVTVTAHGRIVAELVPPALGSKAGRRRYDELVTTGVVRPAIEDGDPLEDWPDLRLPPGTAAALIDSDRDEA